DQPAATRQLPSAALGDRHGGPVAVDPGDAEGLRTQSPVFLLDVVLPGLRAAQVGGRAWVKLALPPEPLGLQAWRRLRQLRRREFNPTGQAGGQDPAGPVRDWSGASTRSRRRAWASGGGAWAVPRWNALPMRLRRRCRRRKPNSPPASRPCASAARTP